MQKVPHDELKNLPSHLGNVEVVQPKSVVQQPDLPCFNVPGFPNCWIPQPTPKLKSVVLPKLSSDEYNYSVALLDNGATITLNQVSSGKKKVFFLAGVRDSELPLINHMNSLTDDLCGQWFNQRDHKKNKKAKE